MADQTAKIDANEVPSLIAVTDDANQYITRLLVDPATGRLLVSATGIGAVTLETNGTPNGSQGLLNLVAGTNVTLTDNGSGSITIASTGGISGLTINTTTITGGTTGQLLYDNAGTVGELTTATYPSLTELSYVKGVTSAIQTQFTGKQASNSNLTSVAGLTYVSGSFVKMTGANTFTLDTNSYALTNQTMYIGTTSVAINRASASLVLTGITSIDGTATNLSGTPALPNGTTATTQSANDNSTNLATTAYVDRIISNVVTSGYLDYITSNYTNSTTSFTQIGTFSKTITVVGNTVLLTLGLDMSVTAYQGYIGVKVDSGSIVSVLSSNSSTRNRATGHCVFTGLSPGSHTFTIWGETTNTAVLTVYSYTNIDMLLQEI